MNSLKCPQCGLINFASASECKRCHLRFPRPESPPEVATAADQNSPDSIVTDSLSPDSSARNNTRAPVTPLPEFFVDEAAPFTVPMVLFAVSLLLTVLVLGYQFLQYAKLAVRPEWKGLINPGHPLHAPGLEALIYLEWFVKGGAMVASALLLLLFLRKAWSFLKWVRVYLLATFLFVVVDGAAGLALRKSLITKDLDKSFDPMLDAMYWYTYLCIITIFITFIWYLYFTKSERVRKTFIN
jgi:Protein of unknown function (DUF2569)